MEHFKQLKSEYILLPIEKDEHADCLQIDIISFAVALFVV